jgi:hypothetical protein
VSAWAGGAGERGGQRVARRVGRVCEPHRLFLTPNIP